MQRNTKSEVTYLGNLYGEHIHSGYAGAVFDGGGYCPTITAISGGNRQPMIVVRNEEQRSENYSDR